MIRAVEGISPTQATFRPAPDEWNILENLEHIALAEYSGVSKIWAAIEGVRLGTPVFTGEHTNRGLGIEEIIARTWKPKEAAPPIATPHVGGTLRYWIEFLRACQTVLEKTEGELTGLAPETVVFPHFLCGPLDAKQRFDFLSFHTDRHTAQIGRIKAAPGFPQA